MIGSSPFKRARTYRIANFSLGSFDIKMGQAMAAGATSVAGPADQFYGDRLARITDSHSNQWSIATLIEDLTPDLIVERLAALGEG